MNIEKRSPTLQEQLLRDVTAFLQKHSIPYMVTGSVSVIRYGRPRTSHDIDFIIEAKQEDVSRIQEAFLTLPHKGFVVDEVMIKDAILHASQFNVFHLPTSLKLDFWLLTDTPFDQERFKRRKNIEIFGQTITFTSPEDTILQKFIWYKASRIEKHLIDAAFVYQIQKESLDEKYFRTWAKKLKITRFLKEIATMDLEQHF